MDTSSFWAQPRPPRETFESVFSLWRRSAALFFEGFDFVFAVMLIVGAPASAVIVALEAALHTDSEAFADQIGGILLHIPVSQFFFAWLAGPIYYGLAVRLQEGEWPSVSRALKWFVPYWPRMTGVMIVCSALFLLGFAALAIPGLYLLVKLSLAEVTVLYEPAEPAIRRSWDLSRYAPLNIFLALGPFLLASIGFTFGVDADKLRETSVLAFAVEWSRLLLLVCFPSFVTALLYGWARTDEDAAAVARLE